MNAAQNELARIKELNRARQEKYYAANKAKVADRRKAERINVRALKAAANAPPPPVAAPQAVVPSGRVVIKKRLNPAQKKAQKLAEVASRMVTPAQQEQSNIDTSKAVVEKAMKESGYYEKPSAYNADLCSIRLVFRAINNEPLMDWIKKPADLFVKLTALRQTSKKHAGEPYALSQFGKLGSAILNVCKIMNLPVTKEQDRAIFEYFRIAKVKYDASLFNKKHGQGGNDSAVIENYNSVLPRVLNKYGENSLTYLIALLYKYIPLRNDYSNIVLIKSKSEIKPEINYMILPKSGNASIFIQVHKTRRLYGTIEGSFPDDVTKLLREYIKTNKIVYGAKLFKSLTETIKQIMEGSSKDDGGVNLIRRSVASTLYDDFKNGRANERDIWEQQQNMGHSSTEHFKSYVYNIRK